MMGDEVVFPAVATLARAKRIHVEFVPCQLNGMLINETATEVERGLVTAAVEVSERD